MPSKLWNLLFPLLTHRSVAGVALLAVCYLALRRRVRGTIQANAKGPKPPFPTDCDPAEHPSYKHVEATTSYGKVRGFTLPEHGVINFRGIPYAAPPTGDRRFRKPQDHPGWGPSTRDCTRFGCSAVQNPNYSEEKLLRSRSWFLKKQAKELVFGYGLNRSVKHPQPLHTNLSEDCLFLNISTPSLTGKYPVAVYIHGGGFIIGSGSNITFQHQWGHPYAKEGIVYVSINYRLGALGFLKVRDGDYNNGLWDQIKALEWVKSEIHNFGGDPSQVCVFGQSAGAMSIGCLLGSPYATRFFNKAILQSGAAANVSTPETGERVTDTFANAIGVPSDQLTVENLSTFSSAQIWTAQFAVLRRGNISILPFQPIVDGELLQVNPQEAIQHGSASHVDLMTGYTKDEWKLFTKDFPVPLWFAPRKIMRYMFTTAFGPTLAPTKEQAQEIVDEILAVYEWEHKRGTDRSVDWDALSCKIITDVMFKVPAHLLADDHIASKNPGVRTFHYRFDFGNHMRAAHAVDLPFTHATADSEHEAMPFFVASTETHSGTRESKKYQHAMQMMHVMSKSWMEFVKNAHPGSEMLQDDWPQYTTENHETMVFDFPVCRLTTNEEDEHFLPHPSTEETALTSPSASDGSSKRGVDMFINIRRKYSNGFGMRSFGTGKLATKSA